MQALAEASQRFLSVLEPLVGPSSTFHLYSAKSPRLGGSPRAEARSLAVRVHVGALAFPANSDQIRSAIWVKATLTPRCSGVRNS